MNRSKYSKRKLWWIYGALGAFLFGTGLSIALESSHLKQQETDVYLWILGGILGIAAMLSGVVFLIRAGILEREMKDR